MNSKNILIGAAVGLAAGAVLGILFAPEKGINTRKNISKKGLDYLGSIKNLLEDILLNATNELEYAKSEAEHLVDKGKSFIDGVTSERENKSSQKASVNS